MENEGGLRLKRANIYNDALLWKFKRALNLYVSFCDEFQLRLSVNSDLLLATLLSQSVSEHACKFDRLSKVNFQFTYFGVFKRVHIYLINDTLSDLLFISK
jgi:hypothetical protein